MARRLTRDISLDRLRVVSEEIVEGVVAALPTWVVREVGRIVGAWNAEGGSAASWEVTASQAGNEAARRIGTELRTLFALEPAAMTRTPLEVVRTAVREPSAVIDALGIPPVERDEFDVRSWPDDRYGLTPVTLGDLGDPELGPLHLAWGMAKAAVLRVDP